MDMVRHQHKTDSIVRDILKVVSKKLKMSHQKCINRYISNDLPVTFEFTDILHERYPDKEMQVDFCRGCRKFIIFGIEEEI